MSYGITPTSAVEARTVRKIGVRLIPFLFILYIAAYLDRVNVSFAQLQMKHDLNFSDKIYGLGAGIFFIGYFLFEVPSNLILERVGARRWIARIMLTWGVLASGMMFVKTPMSFYIMRFLLGVAEAGFFPGVILYLTYWYPGVYRARVISAFMTAIPVSSIIGSPISGALLKMDGIMGLHGWQWLFLLEGLPSVILAFIVFFYLPEDPARARWLSAEEKNWLIGRLHEDRNQTTHAAVQKLVHLLFNPKILLLTLAYFCLDFGLYSGTLWLPQLVQIEFKNAGYGQIGLLTAVPFVVAAVGMVLIGRHSDRTGERRWHAALSALGASLGLFVAVGGMHLQTIWGPIVFLAGMSVAMTGILGVFAPFWATATRIMGVMAVAGGIAFINSIGNLSGYFGPKKLGDLKTLTGNFTSGMIVLGCSLLITCIAMLCVKSAPIRSQSTNP